jgi:signal transduction histidine kinase
MARQKNRNKITWRTKVVLLFLVFFSVITLFAVLFFSNQLNDYIQEPVDGYYFHPVQLQLKMKDLEIALEKKDEDASLFYYQIVKSKLRIFKSNTTVASHFKNKIPTLSLKISTLDDLLNEIEKNIESKQFKLASEKTDQAIQLTNDFSFIARELELKQLEKLSTLVEYSRNFTIALLLIIFSLTFYLTFHLISKNKMMRKIADERVSFMAGVAHDLRSPLQAITSLTELLSTQITHPELLKKLKKIESSASEIEGQTRDLMDFTRLEAGTMILNKSFIYFNDLFQDLAEEFNDRSKNLDIEVCFINNQNNPLIEIDKFKVMQIIRNLVENALYHSDAKKITIEHSILPTSLIIKITDDGIGIDQKDLKRFFYPFERGQSKKFGIGMGLSIVRRLTTLMNGSIHVDSTVNQGSTFTIKIPVNIKNS